MTKANVEACLDALDKLEALAVAGREESAEAEAIRERADRLWWLLSPQEQDVVRQFAEHGLGPALPAD